MGGKEVKRVLLIEEDAEQALSLKASLEEGGLRVTWSADGLNGFLLAQAMVPDLVVLDAHLPGMSGVQVCRGLQQIQITAEIPVVVLTGDDGSDFTALGPWAKTIHCIPKDALSGTALLETVRQAGLIG
jgi:CheY-like chemotaxis protein